MIFICCAMRFTKNFTFLSIQHNSYLDAQEEKSHCSQKAVEMSPKSRRIQVRLEEAYLEKFRDIQIKYVEKDATFKATDQATILQIIDDFHLIINDFPDVFEKLKAH